MANSEGSAGSWPEYSGPSADNLAAEIFVRLAVNAICERRSTPITALSDDDMHRMCFDQYAHLAVVAAREFLKRVRL